MREVSEFWGYVMLWGSILLCASFIAIPFGLAFHSWPLAALIYAVSTAVCAIAFLDGVVKTVVGVLAWCLVVAGGVALIAFGIYAIVTFTPSCQPSATVECRYLLNGGDVSDATVSDQRGDNFRDSLLPILGGVCVLFGAMRIAMAFTKRRWRIGHG